MKRTSHRVKGVILAAGYGTRFLPASKTVPKELFPIIDKPVIDFIVSELVSSGIKDILVITSRRKKVLEDYLDREMELEGILAGKHDKLAKIKPPEANIHFIRQREMRGTADALSLCESFSSGDPFVVAYPDDVVFGAAPLARQLIDVYLDSGKSVLAVKNMPGEDVSRYGVVSPSSQTSDNVYKIKGIVEKPKLGTEPSNLVSLGRYLFTPEIFPVIHRLSQIERAGEFYQTEVINELAQKDRVLALDFEGKRYDTGEPLGYLKTIVDYSLQDPRLKDDFQDYLNSLHKQEQKRAISGEQSYTRSESRR
ncbi:MAG: UTP--glucose-1-phosphate uridylyltransferase [Candidatus Caenarcaniphilales bacterium]|nr:UTP--glucose-1-phosphate uridylyltransferase [Candidatus Caenarcaniphilales bacterium]